MSRSIMQRARADALFFVAMGFLAWALVALLGGCSFGIDTAARLAWDLIQHERQQQ